MSLKVSIERNKADQVKKNGNLKELLIHAKDDAQNSICKLRDRLTEKHRDLVASLILTEYGIDSLLLKIKREFKNLFRSRQ